MLGIKKICISLLFAFISITAFAQNTTPKYSNEFLAIGVGARALAMANAQSAITDDVTAGYWNPAGLLRVKDKYQVGLMHSSFLGSNYDYVGFTTAIDSVNRMGFSVIRFGVDDIPDTRFLISDNGDINYDQIGSFSEASYAFLFSYAREINITYSKKNKETGRKFKYSLPIRLGGNVKIIHRSAGVFASAWGFGLDIGAQTELGKWKIGITGRDITTTFNAWRYNTDTFEDIFAQTGNEIPTNSTELTLPRLLIGVGRTLFENKTTSALFSLGLETTFDGKRNTVIKTDLISASPSAGLEFSYKKMIFLRGGIGNFQQITDFDGTTTTILQPNFGIGLQLQNFTLDYALTNIGEQGDIPFSHVFSLRIAFNKINLDGWKQKPASNN